MAKSLVPHQISCDRLDAGLKLRHGENSLDRSQPNS
jgi:hypothetical protein